MAFHQVFHSNPLSLLHFITTHIVPNPNFHKTLKEISSSCNICSKTNPLSNIWSPSFPNHQARGHLPGSDWQVDFTNMPPIKYIRYLLVFIDTLRGWIEAFPTNKRASTVATTVQQLTSYRVKMALPYPIPSTSLWKSRKDQSHPKKHTQIYSGTSTGLG
jgi:hypothetical protein